MGTEADRRCEQCGGPLPVPSRADRRYCRNGCRQASYEGRQRHARLQLLNEEQPNESAADLDRLRQAVREALREERLVGVIAAEARQNWRASAWLLARVYPDHWGERGRDGRDVPLTLDDDPTDPFNEVDQLAARRRRKPPDY